MLDDVQNIDAGLVALLGGDLGRGLGSLQALGTVLLRAVEPGFAQGELLLEMFMWTGSLVGWFQDVQRRDLGFKRGAGLVEFFAIGRNDRMLFAQ